MSSDTEPESLPWDVNGLNSLDLWDYTMEIECLQGSEDLQLAAELGKTLLERNKELETALKQHQNVIEDQAQEIEYLTKQTIALKEVNDSRLRIYEQLEVSIQDLERANHRLALDHNSDKKQIKSLTGTIESLENKCEDFQKTVDELTAQLDIYKKRIERQNELRKDNENKRKESKTETEATVKDVLLAQSQDSKSNEITQEMGSLQDEIVRLNKELNETKVLQIKEERKISELEEQLAIMIQDNNKLQERLHDSTQNDDTMKSMHDELSSLEEVRRGQLCERCLRNIEQATDDMSSIMDAEEDDDCSVLSSLINEPHNVGPHKLVHIQEQDITQLWPNTGKSLDNDNPYRDLVEKYEALLEVQRQVITSKKIKKPNTPTSLTNSGPLSLQDELKMSGDFNKFGLKDTDEESGHGDDLNKLVNNSNILKTEAGNRKNFTRTPDFSEAETSSSGFSDETSNKYTQTDLERPGSFLCTIADGEDCRFSIYDDGSPIDSRFRNRPEYRELFKEIFTILKKAAEHKDEGEKLPLLDDTVPVINKVPPVTPANEEMPGDFTDETQSIMSSVMSEQSIPMSDITPPEKVKVTKKDKKLAQEKKNNDEINSVPETSGEPQRVLTPLVRQPLEFMSASPQFRKKSSRHKNRKHSQDRQGAESPVIPSPPKVYYQRGSGNRRRRDYRPLEPSPLARTSGTSSAEWNGSSMQFYNRSLNSPTPSQNNKKVTSYQRWNPETDSWDIKQSTASQDLHKLRRLELSYAEVLRNADKNKNRRRKH